MLRLINKAKKEFLNQIEISKPNLENIESHVSEVEKWARFLLKKYPEADEEVVLLSVWFHDIGHSSNGKDHALVGEKITEKILKKWNLNDKKSEKILHCVRAHRCRDVLPETIEAKILAFADSASHLSDFIYIKMAKKGNFQKAFEKLERDYRDLSYFPDVKKELEGLYESSKKWLNEFEKLNF